MNRKANMGYSKKWQGRIDKGMCGNCGNNKSLENRTMCQDCSDYFRKYYKEHYARQKSIFKGGKIFKVQKNATHLELQNYIIIREHIFQDG